ncbi:MAG: metallopeptidase family protein [Trueperaceae bacterium]|nr:metallopeptidase family protein [Trueperaceae bacterium]
MTFEAFRQLIEEMVAEIPEQFMQGLQGVHVLPDTYLEEGFDEDLFRMGEYLDPGPENFLGAGEGLGRHIAIYHGSFTAIAESDPDDFDWEEEAWETLTHELRHHVESLAGEDFLVQDDEEFLSDIPRTPRGGGAR